MRFAGQRFRAQPGSIGKFKAERGQAETGRSPYVNPTGTRAMTNMREVNASSMAFTGMRDMSNPDFNIGNFAEPEFGAPSRI